nr:hypothetical protein [uncultured Anaeromusa sp.]
MKLNFSKKEYTALLEMLYMADWVLHAHTEEKEESTEEYRLLMQKVLEAAKDFSLEEAVGRDDQTGEYYLARRWGEEGRPMQEIERFENYTFWAELVHRLGRRDFIRLYGEERIKQMNLEERYQTESEMQVRYDEEFAQHGLERLEVMKTARDGNEQ